VERGEEPITLRVYDRPMSVVLIRSIGLAVTLIYAVFIGWLIVRQPRTLAEVAGPLTSAAGIYRVDRQAFDEGVTHFRNDRFIEARSAFHRADPRQWDARTQFYIAYSFYRQGWGRVSVDEPLYREGLEAVERAIALAPYGVVEEHPSQGIRTAEELRAELQAGVKWEADDFNPLRLFRERK
jgi:hypothetical protein